MKSIPIIILIVAVYSYASTVPTTIKGHYKVADQTFLERQKNVLRLLIRVHQHNTFKDQVNLGKTWNIEANLESYDKTHLVKEFLEEYHYCYLPKGEVFSIMNIVQRKQAIKFFNILYYAKDWDTFYKTACWGREHINEGMFVYAFSVAVLHRHDCEGMVLPAPYEINPHYFLNTDIIQKAYKYRMQDFIDVKNANNMVIVQANYSGWYLQLDAEQKLTYFIEDIGLNAFYYYFNLDYPTWMGGEPFNLYKDRRGEYYYFVLQQILARYYLERLSNGMGSIPLVNIHRPIDISYTPSLQYHNGLYFPFRPAKTNIIFDDFTLDLVEKINAVDARIRSVIDAQLIRTKNGKVIHLDIENGTDILCNLIQGNKDSLNPLYGYLPLYLRQLLGFTGKPKHPYKLQPSVLEHYETSLRDPIFYSMAKKIVNYVQAYKKTLPMYTRRDLLCPGVKIENIVVDKLITYFDHYDFDLNNIFFTNYHKEFDLEKEVIVKARQMRLNHKPFTYRINIESETARKVVVRLYLGPKYDENGNVISLQQNRLNFFVFDSFIHELKAGKNVLERHSRQVDFNVKDRTSFFTLYQQVMMALQGGEEYVIDNSEAHCGIPNRLLLPKGRKHGVVYQLFVIVTPLKVDYKPNFDEKVSCGVGSGTRYFDDLPMGYPFDRPIYGPAFNVPNMHFQDVTIYHMREEEINASVQS